MTTVTITATDVGTTIAQNGTLSGLRFLVADRGMYDHFTLVDDAPPYAAAPKQLFNSDMLPMCTNANGALQSPFGVCIQNATINFGNLTVAACAHDAVFEVDCTGALTREEAEKTRSAKALDRLVAGTVFAEALAAAAERRRDEAIIAAERIRAASWLREPPPAAEAAAPPLPPDPELIAAGQKAAQQVAAEATARAAAQGPTVVGRSSAEIETELLIAIQRRRASAATADEAAAKYYQAADARKTARANAQAEATVLLKEQGLA
jgi:hypothetical protein